MTQPSHKVNKYIKVLKGEKTKKPLSQVTDRDVSSGKEPGLSEPHLLICTMGTYHFFSDPIRLPNKTINATN